MAITWAGAAWAFSTAYFVGDRVVNGGNVYRCTAKGASATSGGPTGTDSAITDGTVTWAYAGPDAGSVVDVAPELATATAAEQRAWLTLADRLVADADLWGDLLDDGRRFLAAHFGQLARLQGHGQVTSETVGELSRSYAALQGDSDTSLTTMGRAFMALARSTVATLGLVT